ncbi:AMP-binding protein [Streptomyces sp. NPDC057718]|uniref:AMP-binding protein n=1 Tax=Streptomyces sp. NPDC057718 TaxID=3346225 RepID=UPI0036A7B94C
MSEHHHATAIAPAGSRTPFAAKLAQLARLAPERPLVTCGEQTLTRAEFESRTNRLARAYQAWGVSEGSFVTVALPNGIEFLEAVVAIWKAGATPQPVSHRLPERELLAIIELAQPALTVGIEVPGRPGVPAGYRPDGTLSDARLPDLISPSLKAPTSGGSTGRPKLIVSTEEAVVESLTPLGQLMGLQAEGTALATGPLSHNAPLLTATAALFLGCHVVVMERFDAADALRLVRHHGADWMYAVPTMLSRIAALADKEREAADVSSLRTVITMAASSSPAVREFCLDFFGPDVMLELYAATEAQAVALIDGHGWRDRPGSVGRVVIGELKVRDASGAPLPTGQVGELWVRRGPNKPGPYRYIGSEPQQAADGWETVGDLGRLDQDGYLYLIDRKSDMIIVGGLNIYPAEVEAALEEHPLIDTACVVGLPDPDFGQVVHAVLNVTGEVDDEVLLAHLRERLVAYKLPRSFERRDLPLRDEAGKLRRSRIAQEAAPATREQPAH